MFKSRYPFASALSFTAALLLAAVPAATPGRAQAIPVWKEVTPQYIKDQGFNVGLNGVDFGNGVFVALGDKSGSDISATNRAVIFTSPDGSRWTQRTVDFGDKNISPGAGRVRFLNGKFYFSTADNPGSLLYTSPDGATWTKGPSLGAGANGFKDFAFGNGVYVLSRPAGSSFVPFPTASSDLVNWTPHNLPGASGISNFNAIAFGAGRFVIVGARLSTPYVFTSPDGAAWTAGDGLDRTGGFYWLTFGNGTFYVGDKISADGLTWTTPTPGLPAVEFPGFSIPRTASYSRFLNGQFVCSSTFDHVSSVYTSQDAQHWVESAHLADGDATSHDFAYGNGHYVTVTERGIFVGDAGGTNPSTDKLADLSGSVSDLQAKLNQKGTKRVFSGNVTVSNSGTRAAKDVQVAVYLSPDGTLSTTGDRFLGLISLTDAGTPKLGKNGKSVTVPFKFKASAADVGAVTGQQLLFALDPQGTVKESDETNNLLSSGPLP